MNRRYFFGAVLGAPVAAKPATPKPETIPVLVGPFQPNCSECGCALKIDAFFDRDGSRLAEAQCVNKGWKSAAFFSCKGCSLAGKRVLVPVPAVNCEVVES